jgi:ABC-type Zn uptake system ZnuABC Zn-binding protein ZnuA
MKKKPIYSLSILALLLPLLLSCAPRPEPATMPRDPGLPKVLVVESYLADITQAISADRLSVETLMPLGIDPHAFEPSPRDIARIADSTVLVINGAGFEGWLVETLENAGGQRSVIEAAANLQSRTKREGEEAVLGPGEEEHGHHDEGDPHFWLDPTMVIRYVENIRDGLISADPAGKEIYTHNAAAYIEQLKALDAEIQAQVEAVPPEKRLIVTNHESFGYYADRYGFTIIGTVIPSVSSDAAPSAQQLARLIDHIRATGASALFLETGTNPKLAEQIAADTNIRVVTGLHTHSLTGSDGPAPTYIEMMRDNTRLIIQALR